LYRWLSVLTGLQASAGVAGALVTGNIEIVAAEREREGNRALSVVVVVVGG
jgi:hypothetical protein